MSERSEDDRLVWLAYHSENHELLIPWRLLAMTFGTRVKQLEIPRYFGATPQTKGMDCCQMQCLVLEKPGFL